MKFHLHKWEGRPFLITGRWVTFARCSKCGKVKVYD